MVDLRFSPSVIEQWPIEKLLPYANNPRLHEAGQVARIAASIAQFGWVVPAVVDERGILIAGHGRLLAARQLGITEIPVIRLTHLSDAEARALRLADNRLTELSSWDDQALAAELARLGEDHFDLSLAGFDEPDIGKLLDSLNDSGGAAENENEIPEAPSEPATRQGDLWLLSGHRLLCGDATLAADVERLLDDAQPHLLVTDQPYGVAYSPSWRNQAGVTNTKRLGEVCNDDCADWRQAWALFPGCVIYTWHAGVHARTVAESLESCGFQIRSQIIWVKPRFVLSRGDYHWGHEPCYYGVRKGTNGHWQGARDQSTVWHIAHVGDEDVATIHGTQKPVECMRRPIVNNSKRGDLVYEPFAGSGTTIIAAENTGRVCLALEIDPRYCDVIVERWQRFTGKSAMLDGSGCSFDEIKRERAAA
jgi:DNA modification methylase